MLYDLYNTTGFPVINYQSGYECLCHLCSIHVCKSSLYSDFCVLIIPVLFVYHNLLQVGGQQMNDVMYGSQWVWQCRIWVLLHAMCPASVENGKMTRILRRKNGNEKSPHHDSKRLFSWAKRDHSKRVCRETSFGSGELRKNRIHTPHDMLNGADSMRSVLSYISKKQCGEQMRLNNAA